MKLRIKGNSIRLRLTQPEVQQFAEQGFVEDSVSFGGGLRFTYRLEHDHTVTKVACAFDENTLRVRTPPETATRWTTTEEVGFSARVPVDDAEDLVVLVEKDFQCLHKRPGEDEAENFPNPMAGE